MLPKLLPSTPKRNPCPNTPVAPPFPATPAVSPDPDTPVPPLVERFCPITPLPEASLVSPRTAYAAFVKDEMWPVLKIFPITWSLAAGEAVPMPMLAVVD
jgi:hypothetical protein